MTKLKTYDLPEINSNAGELLMPGTIIAIPITMSTPSGWIECNSSNSSLNTYTYRRLHSIISNVYGGTAYSAGITDQPSASTTFSAPNLMGRSAQPVPIPANTTNTLVSNAYHTHNLTTSSNLDSVIANHAGNTSGNTNADGASNHNHIQVQGFNTGGPTSNTPRRTGGTDGIIAHETHTHYGETTYNTGQAYIGNHSHGITTSASNTSTTHSHSSSVSSSSITAANPMPESFYVRYIIKV